MEKNQTQKKSKNQRKKLFLSRCIVFIMLFIMALPMLCSFTYPITISISDPDNYGYDGTISVNGELVSFGDYVINASTSSIVTVQDGNLILNGVSYPIYESSIHDGSYSVDYSVSCDVFDHLAIFPASYPLDATYGTVIDGADALVLIVGDVDDFIVEPLDGPIYSYLQYIVLTPLTPSYSEPITNVWTGLTEWFVGALGSVQGLFTTRSSGSVILEAGTYSFNPILTDFPSTSNVSYGYSYTSEDVDVPLGIGFLDNYLFGSEPVSGEFFGVCYNNEFVDPVYFNGNIGNHTYTGWLGDGTPITIEITNNQTVDKVYSDWFVKNTDYLQHHDAPLSAGGYELTFLGTLAVIGVSISIAFLMIMVIRRFLALRS